MKSVRECYVKDKQLVYTHDKFIYCSEVYKIWKEGANLIEEKYYSSDQPITLKKNMLKKKYKDYTLQRYFTLKFAPKEYLTNNGFEIYEKGQN